MFSIQVGWNVKMIKRSHIVQNPRKLLNFQISETKLWNCTWKLKNKSKMQQQSNVFLDQQRKQMTTMKNLLFICQIRHKLKQTKLKKLSN